MQRSIAVMLAFGLAFSAHSAGARVHMRDAYT
jgi:hypothetical protein